MQPFSIRLTPLSAEPPLKNRMRGPSPGAFLKRPGCIVSSSRPLRPSRIRLLFGTAGHHFMQEGLCWLPVHCPGSGLFLGREPLVVSNSHWFILLHRFPRRATQEEFRPCCSMDNLRPVVRNTTRALIVRDGRILLLRKEGCKSGERYALPAVPGIRVKCWL